MRKQLLYVCPLLLLASSAFASTCANTTLDSYTASGFSCTLDGLTFSDFNFMVPSGMPAAGSVEVSPVNDGTNIGFIFDGPFVAGGGMSNDAILSYMINQSMGSSTVMLGDTVSLLSAGAAGPGSTAQISEGICTTTPQPSGACIPPSNAYSLLVADNGNGNNTQSASVTFAGDGVTSQSVVKNIVTSGGTSSSGGALISSFENTTQVGGGGGTTGGGPTPEPGSLLTLGSGLVATSLMVRKKVRKS